MYNFPVDLAPDDNGTVLVSFPDLPGVTFGDDDEDAMLRAVDALETILIGLIGSRQEIPRPSPPDGRPTVTPKLLGALKLSVDEAMRARGWRKADLARAMRLNPRQIDRLLDLRHASTVAQLEQAIVACGKRIQVATLDVAA